MFGSFLGVTTAAALAVCDSNIPTVFPTEIEGAVVELLSADWLSTGVNVIVFLLDSGVNVTVFLLDSTRCSNLSSSDLVRSKLDGFCADHFDPVSLPFTTGCFGFHDDPWTSSASGGGRGFHGDE